jgi:hypothetical protein
MDKFAEFCLAKDLVGIASSGTTSVGGEAKIAVLSKRGFLDSAASVNRHLESESQGYVVAFTCLTFTWEDWRFGRELQSRGQGYSNLQIGSGT